MKISIIIPCYNEEETINDVIKKLNKLILPYKTELIVVDDGSTDRTAQIIEKIPNIKLVRHRKNKGKGIAIKSGISKASGDIILIQDSDLEYFPVEIPNLIAPIISKKADVVLGSRFLGRIEGMSFSHLLANKFLSWCISLLSRRKITDVMTGYKIFTKEAIQGIEILSKGFEVETELVMKFCKKNLRILEVPIKYVHRRKGKSKINWKHGFLSLYNIFKYWLK